MSTAYQRTLPTGTSIFGRLLPSPLISEAQPRVVDISVGIASPLRPLSAMWTGSTMTGRNCCRYRCSSKSSKDHQDPFTSSPRPRQPSSSSSSSYLVSSSHHWRHPFPPSQPPHTSRRTTQDLSSRPPCSASLASLFAASYLST